MEVPYEHARPWIEGSTMAEAFVSTKEYHGGWPNQPGSKLFNSIEYSTSIEYWESMTLGLPSPFRESAKGIG